MEATGVFAPCEARGGRGLRTESVSSRSKSRSNGKASALGEEGGEFGGERTDVAVRAEGEVFKEFRGEAVRAHAKVARGLFAGTLAGIVVEDEAGDLSAARPADRSEAWRGRRRGARGARRWRGFFFFKEVAARGHERGEAHEESVSVLFEGELAVLEVFPDDGVGEIFPKGEMRRKGEAGLGGHALIRVFHEPAQKTGPRIDEEGIADLPGELVADGAFRCLRRAEGRCG